MRERLTGGALDGRPERLQGRLGPGPIQRLDRVVAVLEPARRYRVMLLPMLAGQGQALARLYRKTGAPALRVGEGKDVPRWHSKHSPQTLPPGTLPLPRA